MSDARDLIDRARRLSIYRQLNPCDTALANNSPSAAQALFNFLSSASGPSTSTTPAVCNAPGQGFIDGPGVSFRRASLRAIIRLVDEGSPGNVVVVHGTRPPGAIVTGSLMARDHHFCLVRLGPPEDDVFLADCSKPEFAVFFPSRISTPGQWTNTIQGYAQLNQLQRFEYTRGPYSVAMSDYKHAWNLIDRARRLSIYRQLNPCDTGLADNCPSAAQALFNFLSPASRQSTSITPAVCNEPGQGFIDGPGVSFRPASLRAIIRLVDEGSPGNVVVVHGIRPPGALVNGRPMARDHYFCLVKLGPPEDDVFWADCSRPGSAMFFPSRSGTPGQWTNTIRGMARFNRLEAFEFTRGPYSVVLQQP
jgi:hypothetical protein